MPGSSPAPTAPGANVKFPSVGSVKAPWISPRLDVSIAAPVIENEKELPFSTIIFLLSGIFALGV